MRKLLLLFAIIAASVDFAMAQGGYYEYNYDAGGAPVKGVLHGRKVYWPNGSPYSFPGQMTVCSKFYIEKKVSIPSDAIYAFGNYNAGSKYGYDSSNPNAANIYCGSSVINNRDGTKSLLMYTNVYCYTENMYDLTGRVIPGATFYFPCKPEEVFFKYTCLRPGLGLKSSSQAEELLTDTFDITFDTEINYLDAAGNLIYSNELNLPTGLNKINNFAFKVFPNPTFDLVTISSDEFIDKLNLRVYNAVGSIVKEERDIENPAVISLSTLNSGVYFLDIRSGTQIIKQMKIIKK